MQKILFITNHITMGGGSKRILLLSSLLNESGHKTEILSYSDFLKGIKKSQIVYLRFYIYLFRKIKVEKIDKIVCNSRSLFPICKILEIMLGVRYVVIIQVVFRNAPYYMKLFYSKKIIAVSDAVKDYLIRHQKIDSSYITVIKNSSKKISTLTSDEIYKIRKELGFNNEFIISCIAHFHPVKGHVYLIKAYKKLITEYPNLSLVLMGYGKYFSEIEKLIQELQLEDNILILPSDYSVKNLIGISEYLLLPSLREGLPTMVLESFSAGKTVIATNIPGTNEIVKHNYNGLLCKLNDVSSLSDCMKLLIDDESLRIELSRNALKTYENEYSFSVYKYKICSFFKI